nr:hypothetical protein HUO10_003329 [Paraburkholderia busanensis]
MASNKILRFGPVALGPAAANIINPPTLTGGVGLAGTNANTYVILRHIRLVNKSNAAATASLFIGATAGSAAGTEFAFNAQTIPANSYVDWYGLVRLDVADFLTGLASAGTSITFEAEGEIGVV